MTDEQYQRWKDFSLRMARHAFPKATPARIGKIVSSVEGFFSWYDIDLAYAEIVDWDTGPSYICDQVSNHLSEHYHERGLSRDYEPCGNKFESQVSCCIRSGLDLASSPSAGVIGFTVGDLRRMYAGGLPDWVSSFFDPPITAQTSDADDVWL